MTWIVVLITTFFAFLAKDWVVKAIATAFSTMYMWSFHGIVKLFPEEAFKLMGQISRNYFTPPSEWAGFINGYIKQMTGSDINIEQITKRGAKFAGKEAATALGKAFMDPMLGLILPTPSEVHTDPMGGANRFMSTNLQFQMNAWLLHVMGDMVSFGAFKSLKDLPNAISWSFGLGWLSWLVMGPPFRFGIVEPMEKVFNKIYTPYNFTQVQAGQLARHGLLSFDGYIEACLNIGIHPQQAAYLFQVQERELPDAWLTKFVQLGQISFDEVKQELTRRGFSKERAGMITRFILDSRKLDLTEKVVAAAADRYKEGILERRELERYYRQIGYNSVEIELAVTVLDLEKSRRRLLTPAQVSSLVTKARIPRVQGLEYLTARIGYTTEDAEHILFLQGVGGEVPV